jgi:hypothetical protein
MNESQRTNIQHGAVLLIKWAISYHISRGFTGSDVNSWIRYAGIGCLKSMKAVEWDTFSLRQTQAEQMQPKMAME